MMERRRKSRQAHKPESKSCDGIEANPEQPSFQTTSQKRVSPEAHADTPNFRQDRSVASRPQWAVGGHRGLAESSICVPLLDIVEAWPSTGPVRTGLHKLLYALAFPRVVRPRGRCGTG